MPEEDNNNAAGLDPNSTAGENNSGDGTEDPSTSKPGSTDAGADDQKGEEGGDEGQKNTKDTKDAKAPQEEDGKDDNKDDGADPPIKKNIKSPKDFIIQRQQKKIEKLKKDDDGEGDDGGDDGSGVAPEDKAIIEKVVSEKIAPFVKQSIDIADDGEISNFLKENPEFKPFEAKARRWIKDPSRQHLPISTVFFEVAGKKMFKIGAERQKQADKEANDTATGGGSSRAPEGGKSVNDMTPEEFEAEQEKVRRGQ